jgi:hypothetical protein
VRWNIRKKYETSAKLDEIAARGEASRRNVGKSYIEVVAGPRKPQDREFCRGLFMNNAREDNMENKSGSRKKG